MAELTEQMKEAVVIALAQFRRPTEVKAMLRDEFDVPDVPLPQIVQYDVSKPHFTAGQRWIPIFEAAREAYIEAVKSKPIANQGYRLAILQRNLEKAMDAGNIVLANQTLEQAAKEVGGVLTNERNLKVENGKGSYRDLEPEERRNMVADMFRELGNAPGSEKTQ